MASLQSAGRAAGGGQSTAVCQWETLHAVHMHPSGKAYQCPLFGRMLFHSFSLSQQTAFRMIDTLAASVASHPQIHRNWELVTDLLESRDGAFRKYDG